MSRVPVLRALMEIASVLTGNVSAAVNAEWSSAGFLQIPASAEVGAVSAVAADRAHGLIYVLHRGAKPVPRFDGDHKVSERLGAERVQGPALDARGPGG
jgi:hypothetical protein